MTIMARPTETSAAATAMVKNTMICHAALPYYEEAAVSIRFAALSIISMHINTMITFLRTITPISPIMNKAALNMI